jgi:D-arabinose 1-dehydrogenase-like Zn-dependent alcohol dehydrogenase
MKISAITRSSPASRVRVVFATATIVDARFAFPLGEAGSDVALAPLLCAGLIGWRSLAESYALVPGPSA